MVQHTGVPAVLCGRPQQATLSNLCQLAEWVGSLQELAFQANDLDFSTATGPKSWQYLYRSVTAPKTSKLVIQIN